MILATDEYFYEHSISVKFHWNTNLIVKFQIKSRNRSRGFLSAFCVLCLDQRAEAGAKRVSFIYRRG